MSGQGKEGREVVLHNMKDTAADDNTNGDKVDNGAVACVQRVEVTYLLLDNYSV